MEKFILPSRLVVFVFIILSVLSSLIIKKNSLNRLFMMVLFISVTYLSHFQGGGLEIKMRDFHKGV